MEVFTVNKQYWTTDHDGWQNWIQFNIVSYHATKEGAQAKISSFNDKDKMIENEDSEMVPVYFISSVKIEE